MSPKKKFGVHDERIFAPPWFLAAKDWSRLKQRRRDLQANARGLDAPALRKGGY
jgi:hypothetical protein